MITYLKNKEYNKVSRYQILRVIEDPSLDIQPSAYLETQNPRTVEESNLDAYHIVKHSEVNRLDLIAHKYYGDASMYWAIALANGFIDPFVVTEGTMLRIPARFTLDKVSQRILAR